VNKKDVGIYTY